MKQLLYSYYPLIPSYVTDRLRREPHGLAMVNAYVGGDKPPEYSDFASTSLFVNVCESSERMLHCVPQRAKLLS